MEIKPCNPLKMKLLLELGGDPQEMRISVNVRKHDGLVPKMEKKRSIGGQIVVH